MTVSHRRFFIYNFSNLPNNQKNSNKIKNDCQGLPRWKVLFIKYGSRQNQAQRN